jgi:hypothetical protein
LISQRLRGEESDRTHGRTRAIFLTKKTPGQAEVTEARLHDPQGLAAATGGSDHLFPLRQEPLLDAAVMDDDDG